MRTIEGRIVGLLLLPNLNWFAYHRLEGFAGKNFVDLGCGYPYYVGFGGWVDRKFVGHHPVGYHGDNHPTLFFGSAGFYHRRLPKVADSTKSNGRVAPRESYDNYCFVRVLSDCITSLLKLSLAFLTPQLWCGSEAQGVLRV